MSIVYKLHGGSPHGLSGVLGIQQCPRKWQLDKEEKAAGLPGSIGSRFNVQVGTAGHAILHILEDHKRYPVKPNGPHDIVFEPHDVVSPDAAEKAWDACVWYQAQFGDCPLGKPLGWELMMRGAAVESAVGISPYTGLIDLLVAMDAKTAKRIRRERGIDVRPGVYVVDRKFGNEWSNLEMRELADPKTLAYVPAAQAMWPRLPIRGLILDCIHPKKTPTTNTFILHAPLTPPELATLQTQVAVSKMLAEHPVLRDAPLGKSGNCFFPDTCRYRLNGKCDPGVLTREGV